MYIVFKIIHCEWKYTHFVKLHILCLQYQSSFFRVPIGKFYTWLNFFTQPAVVMVVTNMKCDYCQYKILRVCMYSWCLSGLFTNGQCQRTEAAQRPGSGTSRGGRRAPPSPASAPPAGGRVHLLYYLLLSQKRFPWIVNCILCHKPPL